MSRPLEKSQDSTFPGLLSIVGREMPPEPEFSSVPIIQALTSADILQLYQEMARIRAFDTLAIRYDQAGLMGGLQFVQGGQESGLPAPAPRSGTFDNE